MPSISEQIEHLPSHMLKALLDNPSVRAEVKDVAAELLEKALSNAPKAEPGPMVASVTTASMFGEPVAHSEPVPALEPEPAKADEAK